MCHIINSSAAMFVYNALNQLSHIDKDSFVKNNTANNLCNNTGLQEHRNSRTQSQLFFYKFSAATTWNSISMEIRTSCCISTFKRKL